MRRFDVLILGSGHAGAQCAVALRQAGFEGSVAILSREADPPYERPPLSKDYLAGEKMFERMLIRPPAFWPERGVTLLGGREVTAVDKAAHAAVCADGERVGYGRLVWAAGGVPRRLACPGGDLAGVHTLRARADADAIAAALPAAERVAVVGGGYVGLETAAVLTRLGKQVVLVEAMERVLSRVAAEPLSRFYESEHRARGVDIRLGAKVAAIEGMSGRACALRLTDGQRLPADLIVVGIGIAAAAGPLLAAGAEGGDGVHVDAVGRTSLPNVYAAGDCAAYVSRWAGGRRIRLESVQNAHDQASAVARHIAGEATPYAALPWFWSHQYDLKLQTIGVSHGHDATVLRGDPAARSFSLIYLRDGRIAALDCVNAVKDYVQGRRLIETGVIVAPERLADPSIPLKELAA